MNIHINVWAMQYDWDSIVSVLRESPIAVRPQQAKRNVTRSECMI